MGIVEPGALVVRDAVHDFKYEIGALEADPDLLDKVLRADPNREPALIERFRSDIADPEARHTNSVLVGVHCSNGFAESLRNSVTAIGP